MSILSNDELKPLFDFIGCRTPAQWLDKAKQNLPLLLIDHAQCERKAAATALNFMCKYPEDPDIVGIMSPLAREELLHFEKVMAIMKERNIVFRGLRPSAYAKKMHEHISKKSKAENLCDQLIIGAIIEARSCERFHALLSVLDDVILKKFYQSLLKSEARHFKDYIQLAKKYSDNAEERSKLFLDIENHYILSNDEIFCFHSGIPA